MAFVGLVGLYACSVRRLRTEKRKAANFWGCFALAVACITLLLCFRGLSCVVAWFVEVALLLLFVGFYWVVGCGFLSLRMIATKRKGKPLGLVLSSFVGCCYSFAICLELPLLPLLLTLRKSSLRHKLDAR